MTQFLNWLVLIAFAAAAVLVARWMVQRAHERWKGPKTPLSMAFLYVLLLATITGVSFVVASVIYYGVLYQGDFMQLVGLPGVAKFLLIFSGVWYAALYGLKYRAKDLPK